MLKELQDFGLSEKEARIYFASLEIGRATADQLAKHAKIVRPTAYVQIKTLMEKGLMSTYEEGKKTYFAPESPELLKRLLLKQKDKINSKERDLTMLLPELLRQFEGAGERPVVRFFPGKEGIATAREMSLEAKEKKTYAIFSPAHTENIFSSEYLDKFSDRRRSLSIHSRGIYVNKAYFNRAGLDEITERRALNPEIFPLTVEIMIFDNKTVISSLEGSLFSLLIESKEISSSMKVIFNFLWERAEEPVN